MSSTGGKTEKNRKKSRSPSSESGSLILCLLLAQAFHIPCAADLLLNAGITVVIHRPRAADTSGIAFPGTARQGRCGAVQVKVSTTADYRGCSMAKGDTKK